MAGGTVGGFVTLVVISSILIFFKRRRRAREAKSVAAKELYGSREQPIPLQEAFTQPPELTEAEVQVELSGAERPVELSGAEG